MHNKNMQYVNLFSNFENHTQKLANFLFKLYRGLFLGDIFTNMIFSFISSIIGII